MLELGYYLKAESAGFADEFYEECKVKRRTEDNLVFWASATRMVMEENVYKKIEISNSYDHFETSILNSNGSESR